MPRTSRLLWSAAAAGAAGSSACAYWLSAPRPAHAKALEPVSRVEYLDKIPSRADQLAKLAHGTESDPFDVLIIGGGATGTGCAVDAITRGLRTALVEREDFAAGTSSRSTKLVHGGVRYLEKAVWKLDYGQLKLERKHILDNAPHLSCPLPIMTPCYQWWEVPYYWMGMKAYDLVAGTHGLTLSRYVSPKESHRQFPTLSETHSVDETTRHLKGTIVYYDGQMDDSRLCVTLACTAALAGAAVANHTEATRLIKDEDGKIVGCRVKDNLTGKQHDVYAKLVINATGPFSDDIRQMSDSSRGKMIMPSAGVHVTLPDYYSPEHLGMIVPKTKDGRVVFMLPWLSSTIAGTTDSNSEITMKPQPTEEEIQFILDSISEFLRVKVRRSDVKSAWSGIRPLASDPNASDTASASRDHVVTMDEDGMITVTGGKWTTYRRMAQDTLDMACMSGRVPPCAPCRTAQLPLLGAHGYDEALFTEVAQNYTVPHRPGAIDTRVAKHLAASYGNRAFEVTKIAEERRLGKRLARGYPMLEAEVVYSCRHEYCETPEDFISRRCRLAFLDTQACKEALPRIVELMAEEKGWWRWKAGREQRRAEDFLSTFTSNPGAPGTKDKSQERMDLISSQEKGGGA
eukprot:jgi/Astpho2/363/Aster-02238